MRAKLKANTKFWAWVVDFIFHHDNHYDKPLSLQGCNNNNYNNIKKIKHEEEEEEDFSCEETKNPTH